MMKKFAIFLTIIFSNVLYSQSGNGHDPNTVLSYTPSGYTVQTYMRQATGSTNIADNTISDGEATDLFVNFIFDTSGKIVYLVYTTDGTAPNKTNGSVVNGTFSNYSDPNRTWKAQIPSSANTQGTTVKYVFYISDGTLAYAWGRISGDGYQTTWNENIVNPFSYTVEAPLPVELTSFIALAGKDGVELNWSTATEVNNYGFDIERCVAQIGNLCNNWEKIGFVQGHGNSNSPKDYSFVDANPPTGKVLYKLKQIDFDGTFEYSKAVEVNVETPQEFRLAQNYPNPFNPSTVINYQLPKDGNVTLKVYDMLGREVATLVNEYQKPGIYNYKFSIDNYQLPSGIYIYQLKAGNFIETKKLMILK